MTLSHLEVSLRYRGQEDDVLLPLVSVSRIKRSAFIATIDSRFTKDSHALCTFESYNVHHFT